MYQWIPLDHTELGKKIANDNFKMPQGLPHFIYAKMSPNQTLTLKKYSVTARKGYTRVIGIKWLTHITER